jgi:hypothetical protein
MTKTFTPYLWIYQNYPKTKTSELINANFLFDINWLRKEIEEYESKIPEISDYTINRILMASM